MKKNRVFIDMDGVLCEYKADCKPEDFQQDGYFRSLAPRKSMIEAVQYLIECGEKEVYILSSVIPERVAGAMAEKNEWLNEFLPMIDEHHRIFPVCGTSKVDAVQSFQSSDVLCDDYSVNLQGWTAAGGKGVKILNEVNGLGGSFSAGPRLRISGREDLVNTLRSLA